MPVSNPQNPLVAAFEVKIDGSPLPTKAKAHLINITVDRQTDLPGMFILEFSGSDTQDEEIPWIDDESLFSIGNVVEVKLGYIDDLETIIVGEITSLEPEFSLDRLPSLTVRGYDRRHRLQRGRKTKTFLQQKDSDIAAQIARESGLSAQVEDSQVVHDYVLQANQTDRDFLQERARRIEYELVVEDKTLFFRPVANAESEILTLSFKDDLLEFYPRLSSMGQVSEVAVRGWDLKEKQAIVAQATTGDEVSKMGGSDIGAVIVEGAFGEAVKRMGDRPILTQAEADQLAKACFNSVVLTLITGEGSCRGRTDLQPSKVIKIEGIGKRFSGQYYVTKAIHCYQATSGYQTHFTVRRNGV